MIKRYFTVFFYFLCLQSGFAVGQTITEIIDATGDGAGKILTGARGVAVDSSGNVYVAAYSSDNAFKITSGGVITEIINSTGDGAGNPLDEATGIAVDAVGNVYVTGFSSNNAFKVTPSGVITEIIDATGDGSGNVLTRPWGIAVDSSGNAYVSGATSSNVFKITSAGVITEIIDSTGDGAGNALSSPYGVTVDSSANVYVTGYDGNVFKITPGGIITEIIDATGDGTGNVLSRPYGVAVDSSSNVYVAGLNSNNAFKITPSGVITEIIDSTGDGGGNTFGGPYGVTADLSGSIYVSGAAPSNAFKITSAGVITKIIDSTGDGGGNNLASPLFIISDASGNVYLSGQSSNNVFKVTFPLPPPTISSATYNASTGVLEVTATNLLSLAGAANDIDVSTLTLTGEGGATYTLTDSADVEISSATAFTVTLSATDKAALNRMLNKNGTSSTGGTTYNLAAADDFVAGVTAGDTADATNAVTVSNVAVPTITSATYDYSTGLLMITGTGLLSASGAANDIDVSKLIFTGQGGATYSLSNSADVDVSSGTAATVSITGADLSAVNALLSKAGANADDGTTYNLAGAEDWNTGADAAVNIADASASISVSNVPAPTISSATYNANTGALAVTATNLLSLAGAANDIDVSKLTLTGEGGATYTLTDSADVEISSATAFTVTLSATDKAALNRMLNKNGTSSTGGTTYNLAAADDFVAGVTVGETADASNSVTVSNVAVPTITSATYDYSTGSLAITGTGLLNASGAANDIDVSKLTFTGQGGATYTLSSSSDVDVTNETSVTVLITGADLAAVKSLLNKNGSSSADSTTYNLATAEDWNSGADAAETIADGIAAITVSNYANPAIASATYNVGTRALLVTGTNFVANSGASNDIDASSLTLRGEGGNSYTLTDSADVEISSGTTFTVTLSATDALHVNGLLNKDGTSASDATTYNLGAADNWMPGSPAANDIADTTGNGVTVTNTQIPTVTSAVYDADTGEFVVTGSNFFHKVGVDNDIDLSTITLTGGSANATYTLTINSDVEVSSATSFTFTLSGADKTATDALLDQLGTISSAGSTYNFAVGDNWLTAAEAATDIADATSAITVSINPKITSAAYNANTGALVVTGTNIQANGAANDIDASKLTLTGEGGVTYTLSDTADVERDSLTQFTLTLSVTDKAGVNAILTNNGTSSTSGTVYNLAAADDWNTNVIAGNTADATNAITVSDVPVPTITSAAYDASTGALVVSGTNLLALSGAANDIDASMLVLTGEGGDTYTLTDSANVDISSATAFTVSLSATDKAAVNRLLNKNGTSSTSATVYNLAANEDWATGAGAAVNVVDATGNGITVSNVAVPTISSATYNTSSGLLVVTGTGYLNLSGAANDIDASKLSLTGSANGTYTLTNTADVDLSSATAFSLTLSATDKAAVNQLLNNNGTAASDSTIYNLAANEDWAAGADVALNVADLVANGITVSGIVIEVPAAPAPEPVKPVEPVKSNASPMVDANGVEVTATIGGGITTDSGQTFFFEGAAFSVGEAIEVIVNIEPDPDHLGQIARIIVAVREARNPDLMLLMRSDGILVPYDGVTLVPFEERELADGFNVNVSKGSPIVLSSSEVGKFEVFVGYELDDGTLVYNGNPITFDVLE